MNINYKYLGIFITQLCLVTSISAKEINFSHQIKTIQLTGTTLPSRDIYIKLFSNKVGNHVIPEDLRKDINYLYLLGYFQSVEARTALLGNGLILEFKVTENPTIKEISVTGNKVLSSESIKSGLMTKPGAIMNFKTLQDDIEALRIRYVKQGYDLARVTNTFLDKEAILRIEISEGEMGTVKWEGLKKVRPFILEREMKSRQGLPFNSQFLRQDRERFLRLGYFSEISPPILQENPENHAINATFFVTEKNVNRIDTGLELDTQNNLVVAFFKGDLNHALIKSDSLSSKVQLSLQNLNLNVRSYAVHYSQPWILNRFNISFDADVWLSLQNERTSDPLNLNFISNRRLGAAAIFGIPIIRDELKFSTRFKVEELSLADPSGASNIQPYSVQSMSGILTYSSLDNRANPRSGSYWTLELERGQDWGLTNVQALKFTRLSLNSAIFQSLSPKSVVGLHLFTGVFRPDAQESYVTFEREIFELGGAGTLRGYKETNPFLGAREILINLEYRYDLTDSIQSVLFWDIGKAFNTGTGLNLDNLRHGYGVGLRFSSPIGPLRVDVAKGDDIIIHFSLGQLF